MAAFPELVGECGGYSHVMGSAPLINRAAVLADTPHTQTAGGDFRMVAAGRRTATVILVLVFSSRPALGGDLKMLSFAPVGAR